MNRSDNGGPLRVGDDIAVESGGKWWAAQIVEDLGGGTYRVSWRYRTAWWKPSTDTVAADRIRRRHEVRVFRPWLTGLIMAAVILVLSCGLIGTSLFLLRPWERPGPAAESARYQAGDRVEIHWRDGWYPGSILEVRGPDAYLVTYDGFDADWNEVVERGRLRPR